MPPSLVPWAGQSLFRQRSWEAGGGGEGQRSPSHMDIGECLRVPGVLGAEGVSGHAAPESTWSLMTSPRHTGGAWLGHGAVTGWPPYRWHLRRSRQCMTPAQRL